MTTNYTAAIMNAEGTDLETVDLRDIETERLRALIVEAGQAGDAEMVAACKAVIASR
jgi:hypothetical protein